MKNILLFSIILILVYAFTGYCRNNKVAIHYSLSAEIISPEKSIEKITYWELFFLNNNIEYDVIYDRDIENGISTDNYHTIVFINTNTISDDSYSSITKFLKDGGGIIVFGEFGSVLENFNVFGHQKLETLSGIFLDGNISKELMSTKVKINNYLSVSSGILPGKAIQISTRNSPPLLSTNSKTPVIIGRSEHHQTGNEIDLAVMIYTPIGKGNMFWCSFDPLDIIGGKSDKDTFEMIIKNLLSFFSGENKIWIENNRTHGGKEVSLLFDMTGSIRHSEKLLAFIQTQDIYPGFIITSDEKMSEKVRLLSGSGEIILKFSRENYDKNNTSSINDYIQNSIKNFQDLTGKEIVNVWLQDLQLNDEFYNSLIENGVRNLLVPDINFSESKTNELNIISVYEIKIDDSMNLISAINSASVIKFDFKPGCIEDDLISIEDIISKFRKQKITVSSFPDYLKWIRIKSGLHVSLTELDNNNMEVQVINRSGENSGSFEVLCSNKLIKNATELNVNYQGTLPDYYFDSERGIVKIFIENLPGNRLLKFGIELN